MSKKNLDLIRQVSEKHLGANHDNLLLHNSDGVTLKEYEDKSEYFDAIVTDPPYCLKAEKYSNDERELGNRSHTDYLELIRKSFERCYKLIRQATLKRSYFTSHFQSLPWQEATGRNSGDGF